MDNRRKFVIVSKYLYCQNKELIRFIIRATNEKCRKSEKIKLPFVERAVVTNEMKIDT